MIQVRYWLGTLSAICVFTSAARAQQSHRVHETEPNDAISSANLVQLGDTIDGTSAFNNIDYYAIDLPAGTRLELALLSRQFCHALGLWDPEGRPLRGQDCFTDVGANDTLYYEVRATGRYYISMRHEDETPGDALRPPPAYILKAAVYTPPRPGPGNPMRPFASNDGSIWGWVATPTGDVIALAGRLVRVDPQGHMTTFASNVSATGQMAIDAFGDLLVPGGDGVSRYSLRTGTRTQFTGPPSGQYGYWGIAIGADGDVWVSEPGGREGAVFSRFDALGNFKEKVPIPVGRTFFLTMSQAGELFFLTQDSGDVYRLINNKTPQRVITAPDGWRGFGNGGIGIGGVSLDRDGWVYVTQPRQGRVLAFDAQYRLQANPLAQVIDSLGWKRQRIGQAGTGWMRDGDGNMTSRMLVGRVNGDDTSYPEDLLEMNPAGMGAPGADPLLHVKRKELRAAAMGSSYADTLRMLDATGAVTWSVVSGSLPSGVTLAATTGVLSGVPTVTGSFDFAVRGTSGARAGFARFTLPTGEAAAFDLDDRPLRPGVVGASYADTLRVLNPEGVVTWSVASGRLPPGVTLTSGTLGTGVLTGVPTDTGSFAFDAIATNGPRRGSGRFTILVAPVTVSSADVSDALMGVTTLTPAVVQYLDRHGNNNGILDVGDLRAYLRALGQLPASPPRSSPR
jgi:hypothetical protein